MRIKLGTETNGGNRNGKRKVDVQRHSIKRRQNINPQRVGCNNNGRKPQKSYNKFKVQNKKRMQTSEVHTAYVERQIIFGV